MMSKWAEMVAKQAPLNSSIDQIDHSAYPASLRDKSDDALRYTIQDCREAIAAMPNGRKAGHYADEIHYCTAELLRREQARDKLRRRANIRRVK